MRTASFGGALPSSRKRRMLLYEARSTSTEKVESGSSAVATKVPSSIRSYSSVFQPPGGGGGAVRREVAYPVATTACAALRVGAAAALDAGAASAETAPAPLSSSMSTN